MEERWVDPQKSFASFSRKDVVWLHFRMINFHEWIMIEEECGKTYAEFFHKSIWRLTQYWYNPPVNDLSSERTRISTAWSTAAYPPWEGSQSSFWSTTTVFPAYMFRRTDPESAWRGWPTRCHPKHRPLKAPWKAVDNRLQLAACARGSKAFVIQEEVMRLWYRTFWQFLKVVAVYLRSRASVLGWEEGFSGQLVKAAINSFAWTTSSSRRKALC